MAHYLSNVVTLQYDPQRCIGCRMCTIVCPHGVFCMSDKKAEITDRDLCMECGACSRNCPADAITVRAGVGCVSGVLFSRLGKKGETCCD